MEAARKPKPLPQNIISALEAHDVPHWYIDALSKIEYLIPKAHVVEYARILYLIAWYRIHYPELKTELTS